MYISKAKLLIGGAAVTSVAAFAGAGALAVFQDPTNVSGTNEFTSGKIELGQNKPAGIVTYTSGGGMMPGHVTNGDVTVTNEAASGANNQLRYSITSTIAGNADLAAALVLTVRRADDNAAAGACTDFDGDLLYTGDLDSGVGGKIVGDPAQGQQNDGNAGDQVFGDDRILAAAASEKLCFRVELPSTRTGDTIEDKTVTASFNFAAEQTVNN